MVSGTVVIPSIPRPCTFAAVSGSTPVATTLYPLSWPSAPRLTSKVPPVGTHYAAASRRGNLVHSPGLLLGEGRVTFVLGEAYVHGSTAEEKYRHREHRRHHPQPPVTHGCLAI